MSVTAVPKVDVYPRHSEGCPKASDRAWKRCRCPKWLTWRQDNKEIRQSAKTRSWEKAQEVATEIEARFRRALVGDDVELPGGATVAEAVRLYLEDKEQQESGDTLIGKLTRLLKAPNPRIDKKTKTDQLPSSEIKPVKVQGLMEWCAMKQSPAIKDVPLPVTRIASVTLRHLEEFRKTWTGGPFNVTQEVTKKMALGVNGTYYQQTTDDHQLGLLADGDGHRGRNLQIGPQVRFAIPHGGFAFKYYRDTLVENKPRGNAFWFQIAVPFAGLSKQPHPAS